MEIYKVTTDQRGYAFLIGVFSAQIMTILMAIGIPMQTSLYSLEMLIGNLFTHTTSPDTWTVGYFVHLFLGGAFAFIYYQIFMGLQKAGVYWGVVFGFCHWFLIVGLGHLFISLHPLLKIQGIGEDYFYSATEGKFTVVGSLVLHLAYGSIVGAALQKEVAAKTRITASEMERGGPFHRAA